MILWSYEGPNGGVVDLTGVDGIDELGVQGAYMPSYDVLSRNVPGGSGTVIEGVRAGVRTVTVPIAVQDLGRSGQALDLKLAQLANDLAPEQGPGRLIATRADDNRQPLTYVDSAGVTRPFTRQLRAVYTGGMEVERTWGEQYGGYWQTTGLVFQADRPYYEPLVPVTRRFGAATPVEWFPFLPLQLGGDSLLGTSTEVNDGATDTYTVITVHNPGSQLRLGNKTTNQLWTVDTDTAGTDPVTVDSRPTWLGGGITVSRPDGISMYRYLQGDLWALQRGSNELSVEVVDGDPEKSFVTMSYFPLYRTP